MMPVGWVITIAMFAFMALGIVRSHGQEQPHPVERLGKQFLYGWNVSDRDVIQMALNEVERRGIDGYLIGRKHRIERKLDAGFTFYDHNWQRVQPFTLRDATGTPWAIYQFTQAEKNLTGFALSRWHCRPEDQDIGDMFEAGAFCADTNARALALFSRLNEGVAGAK